MTEISFAFIRDLRPEQVSEFRRDLMAAANVTSNVAGAQTALSGVVQYWMSKAAEEKAERETEERARVYDEVFSLKQSLSQALRSVERLEEQKTQLTRTNEDLEGRMDRIRTVARRAMENSLKIDPAELIGPLGDLWKEGM